MYCDSASHLRKSMYVSRLGMQLFRVLHANVGITCVDVMLRNVYTMLHRLREAFIPSSIIHSVCVCVCLVGVVF